MKENGISTTGLIEIAGNGASLPQSSWPKKVKWTTRQSWVKFCGHITFVAPYIWEISHMMSPRWKQNSPSQLVGKFGCRYVTWTPPTRYTCTRLGFRTKQSEGSIIKLSDIFSGLLPRASVLSQEGREENNSILVLSSASHDFTTLKTHLSVWLRGR